MFFPEGLVHVFVHGRPVDMRKRFTGLIALTKHALAQGLLSGHVFVFINRRGDDLKGLSWDRSGFCIWSKRLERGRFIRAWSRQLDRQLDVTELKLLLEGIEPARWRLRDQSSATPLHEVRQNVPVSGCYPLLRASARVGRRARPAAGAHPGTRAATGLVQAPDLL